MTTVRNKPPIPLGEPYPLFHRVGLETTKTCTRDCSFCPSRPDRGVVPEAMSDAIFDKIVSELEQLGYDGSVDMHGINEPLLDKKLEARLIDLRARCPRCFIQLSTNWDVMSRRPVDQQVERLKLLLDAGVNRLNVNDYSNRGDAERLSPSAGYLEAVVEPNSWRKGKPTDRLLTFGPFAAPFTKIHNWGGYFEGGGKGSSYCPKPSRQIQIWWNGDIPLCCNQAPSRAAIMGNVKDNTLVEIWNNRNFFEYRFDLQDGRRVRSCTGCTSPTAYPSMVRLVKL